MTTMRREEARSAAPYCPATAAPLRESWAASRPKGTLKARGNTSAEEKHSTTEQHHRRSCILPCPAEERAPKTRDAAASTGRSSLCHWAETSSMFSRV